jgi:hypothetical protein
VTRKELPTLGVVGAFTGRLLKEGGFGEIHEVFDHLYPGIMTLGLVAMAEPAKIYLGATIPALYGLLVVPAAGQPGAVRRWDCVCS